MKFIIKGEWGRKAFSRLVRVLFKMAGYNVKKLDIRAFDIEDEGEDVKLNVEFSALISGQSLDKALDNLERGA